MVESKNRKVEEKTERRREELQKLIADRTRQLDALKLEDFADEAAFQHESNMVKGKLVLLEQELRTLEEKRKAQPWKQEHKF